MAGGDGSLREAREGRRLARRMGGTVRVGCGWGGCDGTGKKENEEVPDGHGDSSPDPGGAGGWRRTGMNLQR